MALQILDHPWHQAHSYRLHALPAEFWYCWFGGGRTWDEAQRPIPPNFRGFVQDSGWTYYDLILCHLDNWCDHRYPLRGLPYRLMNLMATEKYPDAPRVAIMHGTPDDEENRQQIRRLLADTAGGSPFVVTNSPQAYREWGLGPEHSRAILHGYDVDEFWSEKTRRLEVIAVCSGGGMSRDYHGIPTLERIRREVPVTWIGARGDIERLPNYDEYRAYLATALVFLHTGRRSPMPGARTEAMLSGCCVVSTDNHGAGDFIEHGYSGFLTDDAEEMICILKGLLERPEVAYRIGQRGREVARQRFNKERFVADWLDLWANLGVAV